MEYQDNDTKEYIVQFMFFKASTNTRIFTFPRTIDNPNVIDIVSHINSVLQK